MPPPGRELKRINCPACQGKGYRIVQKIKVVDKKSRTETIHERCSSCGGTGDIPL